MLYTKVQVILTRLIAVESKVGHLSQTSLDDIDQNQGKYEEGHLGRVQIRSRPEWHCHGGGTGWEGPACVTLDDDDDDDDGDIYIMMQCLCVCVFVTKNEQFLKMPVCQP